MCRSFLNLTVKTVLKSLIFDEVTDIFDEVTDKNKLAHGDDKITGRIFSSNCILSE